ncbi:hypothetical protein AB6A40_000908 [Gnathostoma spinigerum]|uniref:Uncharacterized protein n=1 Tax=Gnathostoma spinigerum TaxID=75299 RepID=A0ABD6E7Q3_9BILA
MFVFVKHESQMEDSEKIGKILPTDDNDSNTLSRYADIRRSPSVFRISRRKFMYIIMLSILAISHGLMMTPIVYIMENQQDASQEVLDYMFSHFSTIFMFSTLYFFTYCAVKCGRPYAPTELILPSVAYGTLWCIGMTLFFVSNHKLSQTVSFPITTHLPSTIGIMADVCLFGSIKGIKNITYAMTGVGIGCVGVVIVALSNVAL